MSSLARAVGHYTQAHADEKQALLLHHMRRSNDEPATVLRQSRRDWHIAARRLLTASYHLMQGVDEELTLARAELLDGTDTVAR